MSTNKSSKVAEKPIKTKKKRVTKNPVDIDAYIEKIKPFIERDNSLKKACVLAEIPYKTVRDHMERSNATRLKIDRLTMSMQDKAKQVIAASMGQGDVNTAKWWLEKRDKDYQPAKQIEVQTDRANPNDLTEEENAKFDELMNNFFE